MHQNAFKRLKILLNYIKRLKRFEWLKMLFIEIPNFDQKSKSGWEFSFGSISLDIELRAILSKFWVNQNFSSKFQILIKNRNLGRNFILAQSHWKLSLESSKFQFFIKNRFLGRKFSFRAISLTKTASNDSTLL